MEKYLKKNIYTCVYIYIYIYIYMCIHTHTHTHTHTNHLAVHLKLTQHCKSTTLQFLKIKKKRR